MAEVFIVGVGMTHLGKHTDKSVKQLTAESVSRAVADAGTAIESIEAAWFCNTRQGVLEGQHGIRGQCSLRPLGIQGIPIVNTDNACASSSTGLLQAYAALAAGLYDVALVVGTEKMNFPEKRKEMFEAFKGSWDRIRRGARRRNRKNELPGETQRNVRGVQGQLGPRSGR